MDKKQEQFRFLKWKEEEEYNTTFCFEEYLVIRILELNELLENRILEEVKYER